jgi:hypothetical protein
MTTSETKACCECRVTRPLSQFLPMRDGRRLGRCLCCIKRAAQVHRDRASVEAKAVRSRRSKRDLDAMLNWQKPQSQADLGEAAPDDWQRRGSMPDDAIAF